MPKRLSYQLYSSRNTQPLESTLVMLAKAGYQEVEGYGGVYENPKALKAQLDKHGLKMPSGHFSIEMLERESKKAVEIATTLGITQMFAPYIMPDDRPQNAAGWKKFGRRLSVIGEWARSEGFTFGWHNHDFEFVKLKTGEIPAEIMFDNWPLIDWECDVAWIARAKQNPATWIKKYANRITAIHVKDIAQRGENQDEDGWCDVGQGQVRWKDLFKLFGDTRALRFVMEHDNPKDAARFAKRSFDFVSKL
jgi:sugar phosphate isomerase/epimerase